MFSRLSISCIRYTTWCICVVEYRVVQILYSSLVFISIANKIGYVLTKKKFFFDIRTEIAMVRSGLSALHRMWCLEMTLECRKSLGGATAT